MATEYLVELVAYDPAVPGEITLRYSTHGKVTGPSETPAHTVYEARLKEPGDVRRAIYEGGDGPGPVRVALGEIVLTNLDGALDSLAGLHFDGRRITVRRGVVGGAYPSAYPAVYVGTMDDVEVTRGAVRVRLRDNAFGLDVPLQATKYDGDNVGGAGLEGTAEIEGVPKPIVLGRVQQIAPVPVNTAKLIYQVSDGAVQSVDGVYDKGARLGEFAPVNFASTSAANGGHCAATNGATIVVGGWDGANPRIKTTTDGTSWTTIGSLPFVSSGKVLGMAYSPALDRFCAVTDNATGEIATSDDAGATWTIRTAAAVASFLNVRWCPRRDLFIALGSAGGIHTSPTGVTWTAQTSGTAQPLYDVAVGGPLLLAVGANGATTTSPTGVTWTLNNIGSVTRKACIWADGIYYLTGAATNEIYRSQDGVSVTTAAVMQGSYVVEDFAVGGDWVVAMLSFGNAYFATTATRDKGASWLSTARQVPTHFANAMVAHDGRFYVITGDAGSSGEATYRSGSPASYATLAELEDDDLAPAPGSYEFIAHASGSYIRLGSPPAGLITADVTQGASAANRTAAQLFAAVLTRAGYTASDWVAADLTALDTADSSELGLFIDRETSVINALDQIAATVGAWWGVGNDGKFRIVRFLAPSGTPVLALTANDIVTIERLPSVRPSYSTKLQYARYYAPQDRDVALGVSDARRADIAREWREVVSGAIGVKTTHLLAVETTEPTLYQSRADALTEAARRQALRGVKRDRFDVVCELNDETEAVDVGDVVTVTHPRFGLSAGRDFRVVAVEPQRATKRLRLSLWA
jgi:hypothetical protein